MNGKEEKGGQQKHCSAKSKRFEYFYKITFNKNFPIFEKKI